MLTQPLIEKLLVDSTTKIELDTRRCLRSRLNKNNCTDCLESCHSKAIELHGRQIIFDAQKCTDCMQCTAVCPNDAFAHTTDFRLFFNKLTEEEIVLFSCKKGMHNNSIIIPCIGLFSEPLLAAMNSVTKGNCFIDVSHCDGCTNEYCLQALHMNMQNLINKMGEKGEIRLKYFSNNNPCLPSDHKTERRSFLRLFKKTISGIGKEAVNITLPQGEEAKDSQSRQQIGTSFALQQSLFLVPDERICERDVLLSYFFSVSTNGQCNCCPLCSGMCPTGALKRKKDNDKKYLTYTSASCSGCGLCADFCKQQALTLKKGFSGNPNIALRITQ